MSKFYFLKITFLILLASAGVFAQQREPYAPRVLTADDYARAEKFMSYNTAPLLTGAGVRPNWAADGRVWYRNTTGTGNDFVLIDPTTGAKQIFADQAQLNAAIGKVTPPPQGQNPNPNEILSPDGKRAAFIRDWNLWVRDVATKKETQLTTDGVKDFGYATDNAGWTQSDRPVISWSPDSKKIATFQQDQRKTGEMYLVSTNVGHPTLKAWKYPLPGDENVTMIERVIVDVDNPRVIRLKMPADQHRSTLCDDISCNGDFTDVEWSPDSKTLAFVSSSRDHKKANLRVADAATGVIRDVLEEVSPTQYESGWSTVNWRYLPASNEFIWFSEKSGWGHLYLHDAATGKLKNQITTGDFVVREILSVDQKNRTIYFLAGGREPGNPYFAYLYRVGFDGKNLQLLTPENGNHTISISPDGRFFVDSYSQPDVPPVTVLRDMSGKLIANLEKADVSRLSATGWKAPQPFTVKARDGQTDLYGLMYVPSNLDPNKKYPIINYIYPGPQGGSIGGNWGFSPARGDNQSLAELGFVVVQIEGTCNPLRSKKFHDACYGNMADNTLEDQITGMKQLAQRYPFIDLNRVGIWGHSGGGYATAAAMFRYPDFFKVGISESGNHENRNYEDDWGERYIGLDVKGAGGKSIYEDQANQNDAKNLKGKLLLAHGTMDDNVPPYNTYLVVDALIKANKDFDLIMIPNARHGYGAASYYMTRRRWDYFVKNLLGAETPKEYELKPKFPSR